MSGPTTRDPRLPAEPDRHELRDPAPYCFALDRRQALKLVGAGVFVAVTVDATAQESGRRGAASAEEAPPDVAAWIHVAEDGRVEVFTGKAEVGQNIRTSLTQAVADELRVEPATITMVMADTARTPYDMGTFGSRTTPYMAPQLRRAAAAARQAILELAAVAWSVDVASLDAAGGQVRHAASGRTAAYGELTRGQAIARAIGPTPPVLPDRAAWSVAGRSHAKIDGKDFVTGRHAFPSDVSRPGMLHGAVVRPVAIGATLRNADTAAVPPTVPARLVKDGSFLGVTAADAATARKAAGLVGATWQSPGPISDRDLFATLKKTGEKPEVVVEAGSLADGRKAAATRVDATYTASPIAHVPLEPRAAVAEWSEGTLTVWTGTQRPFGVRAELAEAFHLPLDRIRVIVLDTGSAYGGKHTGEVALEAARLARAAGRPVRVRWTRAEEFSWAYVRPAAVIDVQSGLSADGRMAFWAFDTFNAGTAGIRSPYEVPHQRVAYVPSASPLRQGSYRGLAATANTFAREAHVDALAAAAGVDEVEFRLRHLKDARLEGVLRAAAEAIGWGRTGDAPAGIACGLEKGSYVATAVRATVEQGKVRLVRIACAFDCGAVVNPDGLENQVQGAIVQGIGGALFEAVEFGDGRITTNTLTRYRVPRFADVPPIQVVSVQPPGAPSVGAGETPLIALAPAIAGAVFRATGRRVRSLPIEPALRA